jgi:uroporphyrinogen-III synthase
VAEQVQQQLGPVPERTLVAAIGPRTARDARHYGLRVDVVASDRTAESLVDVVAQAAARRVSS